MTHTEKINLLDTWQFEIERSNERNKPVSEALRLLCPDCQPDEALQGMQRAFSVSIAAAVGVGVDILEWHWQTNNFGRAALYIGDGGQYRQIRNSEDVLWMAELLEGKK